MKRRTFLKTIPPAVLLALSPRVEAGNPEFDPRQIQTFQDLADAIGQETVDLLIQNPHLLQILKERALELEPRKKLLSLILVSMNEASTGDYWVKAQDALFELDKKYRDCSVLLANVLSLYDYGGQKLSKIKDFSPAPTATNYDQETSINQAFQRLERTGQVVIYILADRSHFAVFPRYRKNLIIITNRQTLENSKNNRDSTWQEGVNLFVAENAAEIEGIINYIENRSREK